MEACHDGKSFDCENCHFTFQRKRNLKQELNNVEEKITDFQAEKNYRLIKEHVENLINDTDNLNSLKMWELKKKLGAKKKDVPVAKKDTEVKLVTNSLELKELYKNTYKKRMEHRVMKPELTKMYELKMYLFELRVEVSNERKCGDWSSNTVKSSKKFKEEEKCRF